jgi:transposase
VPRQTECRSVLGLLVCVPQPPGDFDQSLVYDGQGFWLATKRLSKGRFRWWPQVAEQGAEEATRALRAHQAQMLFAAGNPDVDAAPEWRQPS